MKKKNNKKSVLTNMQKVLGSCDRHNLYNNIFVFADAHLT